MKVLGDLNSDESLVWSPDFAYVLGLMVTDGNLSKDGRHICMTSKDLEMINNFQDSLGISYNIKMKTRSKEQEKKYYYAQFSNVRLYRIFSSLGLMPNKTKSISAVKVPDKYFFDFLRGHFDGDGTFYSYWDKRWRSSFLFYLVFLSASHEHITWLQKKILELTGLHGHILKKPSIYQLRYAKIEAQKLISEIYYSKNVVCLSRKRIKVEKALEVNSLNARVL